RAAALGAVDVPVLGVIVAVVVGPLGVPPAGAADLTAAALGALGADHSVGPPAHLAQQLVARVGHVGVGFLAGVELAVVEKLLDPQQLLAGLGVEDSLGLHAFTGGAAEGSVGARHDRPSTARHTHAPTPLTTMQPVQGN